MKKEYNFYKILYALKRWKTISIITIVITVVTLIVNVYYVKPEYQLSTQIFVGQESNSDNTNYNNSLYQGLMSTYEQLYKSYATSYQAVTNSNLSESAMEINKNLTVSYEKYTQIMTVSITGHSIEQEIAILEATNKAFLAQAKDILPNIKISIIENPSASNAVQLGDKKLNVFIGFIIGLSIGVGLAFLLEYFNNTFRDREEVENELKVPVIGTIIKDKE